MIVCTVFFYYFPLYPNFLVPKNFPPFGRDFTLIFRPSGGFPELQRVISLDKISAAGDFLTFAELQRGFSFRKRAPHAKILAFAEQKIRFSLEI